MFLNEICSVFFKLWTFIPGKVSTRQLGCGPERFGVFHKEIDSLKVTNGEEGENNGRVNQRNDTEHCPSRLAELLTANLRQTQDLDAKMIIDAKIHVTAETTVKVF